jgi:hypothetical protein
MPVHAGRVDDVLAVRMPERAPIDVRIVGELFFVPQARDVAGMIEYQFGNVDLQQIISLPITAIHKPLAIG